jgi:hypothetical protein
MAKKLEAACTCRGDNPQGMSHDVFGLGTAIGLLMQELDVLASASSVWGF